MLSGFFETKNTREVHNLIKNPAHLVLVLSKNAEFL